MGRLAGLALARISVLAVAGLLPFAVGCEGGIAGEAAPESDMRDSKPDADGADVAPTPPSVPEPLPAPDAGTAMAEEDASASPMPLPMDEPIPPPDTPMSEGPRMAAPGIDESAMDMATSPCEDFYRYACGGWLDQTPAPAAGAATSRFSATATAMSQTVTQIIREALAGTDTGDSPHRQKIAGFYRGCTDPAARDRSVTDLKALLAEVEAVNDARGLAGMLGAMHAAGVSAVFRYGPAIDARNNKQILASVTNGPLSFLRSTLLGTDAASVARRQKAAVAARDLFVMFGDDMAKAQRKADALVALEVDLAPVFSARPRPADSGEALYDRARLLSESAGFDWNEYGRHLPPLAETRYRVTNPELPKLLGGLARKPWPQIRAELAWRWISGYRVALPDRFIRQLQAVDAAAFGLATVPALPARGTTCTGLLTTQLRDTLIPPFVARVGGDKVRAPALAMLEEIEAVFGSGVMGQTWLDAPTRVKALEKLAKLTNKLVAPDDLDSYDDVAFEGSRSTLAHLRSLNTHHVRLSDSGIGRPLDRSRWSMAPWQVNAYYSPSLNEMVFPLGILQPPFFSVEASEPMNFGGIGTVMGHELTHGFDDRGRLFDGDGHLASWWTPEANKAFGDRAACVREQFSSTAFGGLHGDGSAALGENIADLGGLRLAYEAMRARLRKNPTMGAGYRFTAEQQFFLSHAQHWCTKQSPEHLERQLKSDPHAPASYRVNGVLQNIDPFAAAFRCQPGQPMVRAEKDRCEVW